MKPVAWGILDNGKLNEMFFFKGDASHEANDYPDESKAEVIA